MDESERLADVADWYETEGFYERIVQRDFEKIQVYVTGERCLELGCADGAMTGSLLTEFSEVVAVDGAEEYCTEMRDRFDTDRLSVICSLFENFTPEGTFDTIVMAHILEHVEDPVELLERAESWLTKEGRIVIIVPNGTSLHRQVGAKMGVIDRATAIDEHDEELGHRRVYTRETLHDHVRTAGLQIRHYGGIGLKPLTNDQIDEYLTEEIQDAYLRMGDEYPELAAERYVIATKR